MSLPEITFTLLPDTNVEAERLERQQKLYKPGVDFALDENGDLEWPPRFTTGLEAVAQGIRIRLRMIKGELFYNRNYGIPWLPNDFVSEEDAILGNKFSTSRLNDIFRPAILSAPGVISIRSLTFDFNRPNRAMAMAFEVEGEDGIILGSLVI